jgi:hypothetical protein
MPTDETLVAKVLLGACKVAFFAASGELFYRRFEDIAQSPFRLYKEITGKGVTCMLNNNILTALFVECANGVLGGDVIREDRVEVSNT